MYCMVLNMSKICSSYEIRKFYCGWHNKLRHPKVFNKSEEKWEKVEESGKIFLH